MTLSIRRAVASDAPALSSLMHAASAYRGEYAAILDGYAIGAEQIQRDQVFLATDGDTTLGFYSLANVDSEPELDLMFVADKAQGTGIGAILFEHMRNTAQSLGIARVKIVSHPPAERFYTRMGAERIGLKPPSGRVTWSRPILVLDTGAPPNNSFKPKPLRGSA